MKELDARFEAASSMPSDCGYAARERDPDIRDVPRASSSSTCLPVITGHRSGRWTRSSRSRPRPPADADPLGARPPPSGPGIRRARAASSVTSSDGRARRRGRGRSATGRLSRYRRSVGRGAVGPDSRSARQDLADLPARLSVPPFTLYSGICAGRSRCAGGPGQRPPTGRSSERWQKPSSRLRSSSISTTSRSA